MRDKENEIRTKVTLKILKTIKIFNKNSVKSLDNINKIGEKYLFPGSTNLRAKAKLL